MRSAFRLALALFSLLATLPGAAPSRAQSAPPAIQSLFLGDRTCGDNVYDCAYPGIAALHRYLHVVLDNAPGEGNWQVQAASTCAENMPGVANTGSASPRGFSEVVVDLAASAPNGLLGAPACYVFRGMNGHQATFYAAYFDDNPARDADAVYPGYQNLSGRPDLPDLDVAYISRSPKYAYDARPNRPSPGQQVVFEAHLINVGAVPLPPFSYVWLLDGRVVGAGATETELPAGQETVAAFTWRWDPAPHTLTLEATVATPQISAANDRLSIRTDALSLGFWVERSAYLYFRRYQWQYCRPLFCAGSDSFEDWLQRQVAAWNRLLERSVYPGLAPAGIADRIRLDELTIVPDGALPLAGPLATNTPDTRDRTVDLEWGLPFKNLTQVYSNQVDGAFDLDWSTIHELNHARSLADLYRFDIPLARNDSIAVTAPDGRTIFDPANPFDPSRPIRAFQSDRGDFLLYQNREQDLMSCPCSQFYSAYSALVLNRIRGQRARCGNFNPPCNFGDWFTEIPPVNRIRLLDRSGGPLPDGATVRLFYDTGTSYNGHTFDNAHATVLHVRGGQIELGSDPFQAKGSAWVAGHNLLLLEVEAPGSQEFCFQEPTDFNLAYWLGYRDRRHPAIYTLQLGRQVWNGCSLRLPPALVNDPFATSPYRSRVSLGGVRQDGPRRVRDVTVQLLDDAPSPDAMQDRLVEVWSASGKLLARGVSDSKGMVRLTVPSTATSIQVEDVTDNHLQLTAPARGQPPATARPRSPPDPARPGTPAPGFAGRRALPPRSSGESLRAAAASPRSARSESGS